MKSLITIAAAALALMAGFASAEVASGASTKAALHYDCTKKGNANKAACKSAAVPSATPAAAAAATVPVAPAKKPSFLSKLAHPAAPTAPATPAATVGAPAAMSAATASTGGHPVCKKGKPCGNSCISMSKTCHKP